MKHVLIVFACSTMLFACKKDIDCPRGFLGADCDVQETPQSITFNSVDLIDFPATQADGSAWDASDGPDIFFRIFRNEVQIFESEIETDVLPGANLVYTEGMPFNAENVTDNFTITFYDEDGLLGNQEMGSFSLDLYSSNNNFPEIIDYTNPGGSNFIFSFHVDYNH